MDVANVADVVAQLLPQAFHVGAQRLPVVRLLRAPDAAHQLVVGDDPTGVVGELREQLEFDRRQDERLAGQGGLTHAVVHDQVAQHKGFGRGRETRLLAASQRRANAGHQLGRRERLDDVVGRARLEGARDHFVLSVGGNEDHRRVGQAGDVAHQIDGVDPGQNQVEQDQIGPILGQQGEGVVRIAGDDHFVADLGQGAANVSQRVRIIVDHENPLPHDVRRRPAPPADGRAMDGGLFEHRQGEGEAGAESRPLAFRPDAPAVRLDDAFADGESQTAAGTREVRRLPPRAARRRLSRLAEELRQLLGGDAAPVVDHREFDVQILRFGAQRNARGRRCVRGGVVEQIAQHLDDAPAVGAHDRQIGLDVDFENLTTAGAEERAAGPVDQVRHLYRLGADRQHAAIDPRHIQQIADHRAHVVGLVDDDPQELIFLARIEIAVGVEDGAGRAADGAQRGAQLVTDHAQELGPRPLHLFDRRQVLDGDHDRLDRAVPAVFGRGTDRGDVDQRGQAAPVGAQEDDLVGAHRFIDGERLGQRELAQRDFASVGLAHGQGGDQLLGGPLRARRRGLLGDAQHVGEPPRFAVERGRRAAGQIEHDHGDRRHVDQRLQIAARALLLAVAAGVGDDQRDLRGEHLQRVLVGRAERLGRLALGDEQRADIDALVPHRDGEQGAGLDRGQELGQVQGGGVGGEVVDPQRAGDGAQVLEKTQTVGHLGQGLRFFLGHARDEVVLDLPVGRQRDDDRVAGVGQGAGAVQHAGQDQIEIEALVDLPAGFREPLETLLQVCDPTIALVCLTHPIPLFRRLSPLQLRSKSLVIILA